MDRQMQMIHNIRLKNWRWRDSGIGEKIILKWILSSLLLERDLDLLGSGLEPMARYCEQCQAHSVPKKKNRDYLEQQNDY